MKYILASASPRRQELLTQAGITFDVIPSSVEEKITKTKPSDIVTELAAQKAQDVFSAIMQDIDNTHNTNTNGYSQTDDITVIGADTIVVYHDEILGKPSDIEEAYDMLSLLADRTHQVYTGVCLITRKNEKKSQRTFFEKTDVTFYPVTKKDLRTYAASGDPLDKAGAYGIQGPFAIHVKCIQGDYNNVVGLPIGRLYQELKESGCF